MVYLGIFNDDTSNTKPFEVRNFYNHIKDKGGEKIYFNRKDKLTFVGP